MAVVGLVAPRQLLLPFVRDLFSKGDWGRLGMMGMLAIPLVILAPFLTDRVRLFGTRREGYLIVGGVLSVLAWLAAGWLPLAAARAMAILSVLNLGQSVVMTAARGGLTDHARRLGATGVLAAGSIIVSGLAGAVSSAVPSFIESRVEAAVYGALLSVSIVVAAALPGPLSSAGSEPPPDRFGSYLVSRRFWSVAVVNGLAFAASIPKAWLGGGGSDLIKVPREVLWRGSAIMTLGEIVVGIGYALACRRVAPRILLPLGILAMAGATLAYLAVPATSGLPTALAFAVMSIGKALAVIALLDVTLRSVPHGNEAVGYMLASWAPEAIFSTVGVPLVFASHASFSAIVVACAAITALAALLSAVWIPRTLTVAPDVST
jgi:hypothetical protein